MENRKKQEYYNEEFVNTMEKLKHQSSFKRKKKDPDKSQHDPQNTLGEKSLIEALERIEALELYLHRHQITRHQNILFHHQHNLQHYRVALIFKRKDHFNTILTKILKEMNINHVIILQILQKIQSPS